ncbi:hypothetical protein D3C84_578000 [compost metagenome]
MGSVVTIGPIIVALTTTVNIRAGQMRNTLAIIKSMGDRFERRLLVTTNPLRKKNIFTASEPE